MKEKKKGLKSNLNQCIIALLQGFHSTCPNRINEIIPLESDNNRELQNENRQIQ